MEMLLLTRLIHISDRADDTVLILKYILLVLKSTNQTSVSFYFNVKLGSYSAVSLHHLEVYRDVPTTFFSSVSKLARHVAPSAC